MHIILCAYRFDSALRQIVICTKPIQVLAGNVFCVFAYEAAPYNGIRRCFMLNLIFLGLADELSLVQISHQ